MSKSQSECNARCPAAGSIANALSKAGYVLSSEFRLSNTVSFSRERDTTCALVERRWKSFCVSQRLTIRKERTRLRFDMAVKGCKRLFDKPCKRCDAERSSVAVQSWISKMKKSHDFEVSPGLLTWIRDETRSIVRGWGRKLADARHALDLNPGHEGCREMATGLGGGLATPRFGLIGDPAKCRLGYCKTKGKFRVVTMQSVYVKEKMRPLHNALYDHLSEKDWLVRGDVSFSDFKSVSAGGHSIISGDYEGATDNIHHSAVMAIIDVLCEEERLTKKEVHILRESFRTPWWVSCAFGKGAIERGSMMGNLVSFPLLCILNRVCHVISMKRSRWSGPTVGRFNGDDCMFPGDKALYDEWRRTTGEVGLIVNEDKTMFSNRFCELNSQAFDIKTNQLISKTSLNFFGLPRDSPGEILTSVLEGIKGLKVGLQLEIVNRMMRYEISVRGVSLSNISTFWQRQLIKRKWFRTLLSYGSAPKVADHPESTYFPGQSPNRKMYSERKFEVVRGPLPKDEYVPLCDEISHDLESYHLDMWRGISRIPITYKHDRVAHKESLKRLKPNRDIFFTSIKETWCYLWPRILLDIVQDQFPNILREKDVYTRTLVANSNRISPQYSLSFHRKYRWFQPPTELVTPIYFSRNTDGGVKL